MKRYNSFREFLCGEYCFFLFSLFYGFLVFSPFLREHWVHDTYCVSEFGYKYMQNGLFYQGRIISYLFHRGLDVLNPPYAAAMPASVSASLIFLSFAAFLTLYLFNRYNQFARFSKNTAVAAFLASISIFFNLFILDSLLFLENCVMSLGILFSVISCCFFIKGKFNYFVSLLFLIASGFCYQADIAFFLPLVFIFTGVKYNFKLKPVITKSILACGFYIFAAGTNYIFMRLISSNDRRFNGETDYGINIINCLRALRQFFKNTFGFSRDFLFSFFVVLLFLILVWRIIRQIKAFIIYFPAMAALIICALLPHVAMTLDRWYIMPRSAVAMAGIGGIIMLCAVLQDEKTNKAVIFIFAVFVLFVAQTQIDIQKNNYANNKLDDQEISYIVNIIRDYETETGVTVKNLVIAFDTSPVFFRSNLNNYGDLTARILSVEWMITPMINKYSDKNYPVSHISDKDHTRLFNSKNWDELSREQLVFEGETVYFCIY